MELNEKELHLAAVISLEVEKEGLTLKEVLNVMKVVIRFFIHKAKL